ncbi:hypothetical protein DMA11_23980 [Marinilabiliaceae bacterium JC017]|nr:hypothetical protein DMA11_23980 [Marinilabiliaceae bacterium JC017]
MDEQAKLKAIPKTGYQFKKWTGDFESTKNPLTIQIISDVFIRAIFEKVTSLINEASGSSQYYHVPYSASYILYFDTGKLAEKLAIEAYNPFGQLVIKTVVTDNKLSVAHLDKGRYLIKLDKGKVVQNLKMRKH